jgi:CheY-like chemotaxis protein/HPt (histidine-containing phosphotransfer) domain-containing protein
VHQSRLLDAIATVMATLPPVEEDAGVRRRAELGASIVTHHSIESATAHTRERRLRGHVLVAEDNQVNQKVAIRMLERLGYRADVAANGLEALEALSRIPYAAVLMDVQMPEMDGYEATAEIRRREGPTRRTPIIALTANAMQGDRERALEAGMDDYLPKPVKPEALEAVLERWVSRSENQENILEDATADNDLLTGALDPLDHGALEGLRELGGKGFLEELKDLFLEQASVHLESLRRATAEEDALSIERAAHTLKGSCINMGASRMADICIALEHVGHSGELERALVLVERLDAELERVRGALERVLATG